jgi:hypothetical protein
MDLCVSAIAVTESLFLLDHGHSPYQGDVFHQPPLLLLLFFPLSNAWAQRLVFVLVDCLIAFALRCVCFPILLPMAVTALFVK